MTSRWQGPPYFSRYGRELVSKLAISINKRWGGCRETTRMLGIFDCFGTDAQSPHRRWAYLGDAFHTLVVAVQRVRCLSMLSIKRLQKKNVDAGCFR